MIIVLDKRRIILGVMAFFNLALVCTAGLPRLSMVQPVFSKPPQATGIIILDAGHGGEDGGAVSPNGVRESELNLQIAEKMCDLFQFCGQSVLMTRVEDKALDQDEPTVRKRKASDLRARVQLVNDHSNAVLISVHQNNLPSSPETHGAQMFWNQQPGAQQLAAYQQEFLNELINSDRIKQTRQIPSSVYLMKHSMVPSVLVECGFLSNSVDLKKLQTTAHQQKLALSIAAGFLQWKVGEETA